MWGCPDAFLEEVTTQLVSIEFGHNSFGINTLDANRMPERARHYLAKLAFIIYLTRAHSYLKSSVDGLMVADNDASLHPYVQELEFAGVQYPVRPARRSLLLELSGQVVVTNLESERRIAEIPLPLCNPVRRPPEQSRYLSLEFTILIAFCYREPLGILPFSLPHHPLI